MKRSDTSSRFHPGLLAGIILLVSLPGCRSTVELSSTWSTSPVLIDGINSEWSGNLVSLDSPPVSVGFRNDGENLYLCLATTDRFIQAQMLFAGLTVWVDSETPSESFGIQFPLRQDRPAPAGSRERFEDIFRAFEPRMHTLLILQGADRQQFSLLESPGIYVRLGVAADVLVYELQVPLRRSAGTPYAAVPGSDGFLNLRFETIEADRDNLPGGVSSRPGGRGRRGLGGGPPSELGSSGSPERLRFSLKVRIAPSGL